MAYLTDRKRAQGLGSAYDVVVVGAGGSGLRATLGMANRG
jgi:ribulose 1,5-bisphosphate synthetase/thiazole synthase